TFDVIFLRNVMIYFPQHIIQRVVDKLSRHLRPGGYLFIGHSETLNGIRHDYKPLGSAIFEKRK
ncbi:MAG: CheR family methyltransferase, partial [Bacteriovoracia bacterium]